MKALVKFWIALCLGLSFLPGPVAAQRAAGLPEIAVAELPEAARETLRLIRRGGPFPYERDGAVFGNFEKLLPAKERGYYREYTVKTPGVKSRGARRIVAGRGGEFYYTSDHYQSFTRVRE
jgi:ribonuclease T1